ncbi:alpha/beta hydrolase [Lichenibacterium dinghuense]|uniref:alpha/beta hydrolase n=1 Tax=Lichenibacterium dinghuense TaxID=2895977 RepID=UPI001F23E6B2|nr:alpha/beta hydrolase [Lichenibacterium sp. 6Y81]
MTDIILDPWLDAEYDNRAKVPGHPAIIAGWARDAAAFLDAHPHADLGLRYGAGPRQAMDVFWPGAARGGPLALFIHGGYWAALDRSSFSHLARGLLAHGVAVAMPSYDLCPGVSLEELVDEVRDAAAFAAARAGRPVHATGHSAGGHLTAMLLATDWRARGLAADAVSGGCAVSGLFDLEPLIATKVNLPLGLDAPRAAALSPALMPKPRGRLRAVVGELEGAEYLRQSAVITAAWRGTFGVLPGADHFTAPAPLADPDSALVAAILADMRAA